RILKQIMVPTPKGCIEDGYLEDEEALVKTFKELLRTEKIKTQTAYLLIDSSQIITREIEFEGVNNKYLKQLLGYRVEEYLPIQAADYEVDFQVTKEFEEEGVKKLRILAVAAPKVLIRQYIGWSRQLNLKLKGISIQSANIGRCLSTLEQARQESVLVIDIGGKTTNLTIIEQGVGRLTQKIDFGIEELDACLEEEFEEEDLEEIQAFKMKYGAIYEEVNLDEENFFSKYISVLIKNKIDEELIKGIETFIKFYETSYAPHRIKKMSLIGGGAYLKNIEGYLENSLGIEAEIIKSIGSTKVFEEKVPYFANLLGLVKGA
ncbi:MAG: pilus assembly protein PilM, partial [Cellulosilyticaceae bacterium]